jgi:hypothetical protein
MCSYISGSFQVFMLGILLSLVSCRLSDHVGEIHVFIPPHPLRKPKGIQLGMT